MAKKRVNPFETLKIGVYKRDRIVYNNFAMINKKLLFDVINYNHFSIKEMAYILNMTTDEFKKKLDSGILQSNEIEMMLHFLIFPVDPLKIFFDTYDFDDPKKIDWSVALDAE